MLLQYSKGYFIASSWNVNSENDQYYDTRHSVSSDIYITYLSLCPLCSFWWESLKKVTGQVSQLLLIEYDIFHSTTLFLAVHFDRLNLKWLIAHQPQ